jgi:choline dehydrogenase
VALSVLRWLLLGSGPFRHQVNSCNVVIRTSEELHQPDIQLMCNPVRMDAKVWWPLVSGRQAHLLTTDAVLLHPKSRGRVSLRSADPLAKPRIQFNALSEPDDLVTLRRGCAPRATSTLRAAGRSHRPGSHCPARQCRRRGAGCHIRATRA